MDHHHRFFFDFFGPDYFPSWWYWSNHPYTSSSGYSGGVPAATGPTTLVLTVGETPPIPDDAVVIGVRVPADAEIWFEGNKTNQTGTYREFVSPPLTPDKNYTYEVRARWVENGRVVERTRRVPVHAGDRSLLNFVTAPTREPSKP